MSRLEVEINGQPAALERFLRESQADVSRTAAAIRERSPYYLYIVARGSSENAARYGQYILGEMPRIPVCLGNPSLFTHYRQHPDLRGSVVCAISQSGQSPDTCDVIETARSGGHLTVAVTNDPDSRMADAAELVILLHADERSLAATQTYSNSLAAFSLLAAELADDAGAIEKLRALPASVEKAIEESTAGLEEVAREWKDKNRAFSLGRGYNYSTAYEIALKLKELTYILAHPYSSAEFLHGPIAVVGEGFPVVLVGPTGVVEAEMPAIVERLQEAGADTLVISDDESLPGESARSVHTPWTPEWLSPLVSVVPGQVLALRLSEAKGHDPDNPRGLKKVTKTV